MKQSLYLLIVLVIMQFSVRAKGICSLEVEQVFHKYEIILRVIDEYQRNKTDVTCNIYRVLESGSEMYLDTVELHRVKKEFCYGYYLGIYRDGKDMPHGSRILVRYVSPREKQKPVLLKKEITITSH